VLAVLEKGDVIEEYEDDNPFSSALILGIVGERPLHVVVALDKDALTAYTITVYEPKPNVFGPEYRERKKR
jgi:hypothetical protein